MLTSFQGLFTYPNRHNAQSIKSLPVSNRPNTIRFGNDVDNYEPAPIREYVSSVMQAENYHDAVERLSTILPKLDSKTGDRYAVLESLFAPGKRRRAPIRKAAFQVLLKEYVDKQGQIPISERNLLTSFADRPENANNIADCIKSLLADDYHVAPPIPSYTLAALFDDTTSPIDDTERRFGHVIPPLAPLLQSAPDLNAILKNFNWEVQGKFWLYMLENQGIPNNAELPKELFHQLAERVPEQAAELFNAWSSTSEIGINDDGIEVGPIVKKILESKNENAITRLISHVHQILDDDDWKAVMVELTDYAQDCNRTAKRNLFLTFIGGIPQSEEIWRSSGSAKDEDRRNERADGYLRFLNRAASELSRDSSYTGNGLIDCLPGILPEKRVPGAAASILQSLAEGKSSRARTYAIEKIHELYTAHNPGHVPPALKDARNIIFRKTLQSSPETHAPNQIRVLQLLSQAPTAYPEYLHPIFDEWATLEGLPVEIRDSLKDFSTGDTKRSFDLLLPFLRTLYPLINSGNADLVAETEKFIRGLIAIDSRVKETAIVALKSLAIA